MNELERIIQAMRAAGFEEERLRPAFVGSSTPEEVVGKLREQGFTAEEIRPFFVGGSQPSDARDGRPRLDIVDAGLGGMAGSRTPADPDRGAQVRSMLQGVPVVGRFADEVEAVVRSALPGRDFGTEVTRIREQLRDFRERRPGAATKNELLGAGIGTAATLGRAAAAGLGTRIASTAVGRVGQAAGLGAAEGALSGFGGGEGMRDRLQGAATEGVIGGVAGGTLGAGAEALSSRRFADAVRRVFRDADEVDRTEAIREIAERIGLDADDLGNDEIAAVERIVERARALPEGSEARLVDLTDDNARQLFRDAFRTPSANRTAAREVIQNRQATAGRRAREVLFDEADLPPGTGPDTDPFEVSNAIAERQSRLAGPLYAEARQAPPVDSDRLRELIRTPRVRRIYERFREVAAERGTKLPPPDADDFALPVSVADDLKKKLDDEVNKLFDAGDNFEARTLKETRNEIREIVKDEVPAYADALEVWGSLEGQRNAIRLGAGDFPDAKAPHLRSPAQMRRDLATLDNDAERRLYRLSAISEWSEQLKESSRFRNQAKPLLDAERDEERLRVLFGDDVFERVRQRLLPLDTEQQISNTLRGGSPTAADQRSLRDAAVTAIEQTLLGGPRRALGVLTGEALAQQGIRRGVAGQVNRLGVVERPQDATQEIFDLILRHNRRRSALSRLTPAAGLAGGQTSTGLLELMTGTR